MCYKAYVGCFNTDCTYAHAEHECRKGFEFACQGVRFLYPKNDFLHRLLPSLIVRFDEEEEEDEEEEVDEKNEEVDEKEEKVKVTEEVDEKEEKVKVTEEVDEKEEKVKVTEEVEEVDEKEEKVEVAEVAEVAAVASIAATSTVPFRTKPKVCISLSQIDAIIASSEYKAYERIWLKYNMMEAASQRLWHMIREYASLTMTFGEQDMDCSA
jgi:cytoskeletal protein RodZ